MKKILSLLCLLVAWMAPAAQAMTLVTQGDTLFATGDVADDYRQFAAALDNKGIERIVFVNSPGGDLWTGMQIGRLIADRGLNTVVAGYCISACSIMFMGGRLRTFSDTFRPALTYVGIHGPSSKYTSEVNQSQAGQIYAFFQHQMGEHFNADFVNQALFNMEDAGALTKVFDAYRLPKQLSYHCKSEQSLRKDCNEFKNEDAYTLGVVTSVDLTPVDLPASFKAPPRVLGVQLSVALDADTPLFKQLSDQQCKTDRCRQIFTSFASARENKALAIPLNDTGVGWAGNSDSLAKANWSALYLCNHIKDKPARLCETQTINGYDVRTQLYVQAEASHAKALQALKVPAEKFYGEEEYGGVFTHANGLRIQKLNDITPQKIDGIQTIGTQALAQWIKSAEPPVVVDVCAAADEAIPSAVTLLFGGYAFEDPATDAAYKARFEGLLKLLSPDPAKPLVFYCVGRDYWLSVNAAIRARDLGYAHVNWYRGGTVSWKAAGLPTANAVVRAVVQ